MIALDRSVIRGECYMCDTHKEKIARLEAELADAKQERDGFEQTMQDNADVARRWEAEVAASHRERSEYADLWLQGQAAIEVKDAALRFFGKHTAHHGYECECAQILTDALSDTAGEGWLEVREQAREALEAIAPMSRCSYHRLDKKDGHDHGIEAESPTCGHCGLGRMVRAALDALRGK